MANLNYIIKGKFDKSAVDQANNAFNGMASGAGAGIAKMVSGFVSVAAVIGVVKKAFDFAKDSSNKFAEAQANLAKMSLSFANNNKLTEQSLKNIINLSSELQKKSIYGDDELQKQAAYLANLGLTEQQIKDTLNAAVDLASSGIASIDTAVEGIGRSYLGVTKGIGTLLPEIKNLTEEQLKAGAATEIINKRFGGMAEVMASTVSGTRAQFSNLFGDFQEKIGMAFAAMDQGFKMALIPVLESINTWFDNNTDKILEWAIKIPKILIIVFEGLIEVIGRLFQPKTYIDSFKLIMTTIWEAVKHAFSTMIDLIKAIAVTIWEPLKTAFNGVVQFIVDAFGLAINGIIKGLNWVITQINKIPGVNINTIKELGKLNLDTKLDTGAIGKAWKDVADSYITYLKGLGSGVVDLFGKSPLGALEESFGRISGVIKEDVSGLIEQIKNPARGGRSGAVGAGTGTGVATEAMSGNYGLLGDMNPFAILGDAMMPLVNAIVELMSKIQNVAAVFGWLETIAKGTLDIVENLINDALAPVVTWLQIFGRIIGAILVPIIQFLAPIISALGWGMLWLYNKAIVPLVNGIIWVVNLITAMIATVWNAIATAVNAALGWAGVKLGVMGVPSLNQGQISPISEQDYQNMINGNSSQQSQGAGVSTGAAASYSGNKEVNVYINFAQSYINGDARAIALMLRDEIKAAEALGY